MLFYCNILKFLMMMLLKCCLLWLYIPTLTLFNNLPLKVLIKEIKLPSFRAETSHPAAESFNYIPSLFKMGSSTILKKLHKWEIDWKRWNWKWKIAFALQNRISWVLKTNSLAHQPALVNRLKSHSIQTISSL